MSSFSAAWLALREPADVVARSSQLARRIDEALPHGGPSQILDLAGGTGANVRYLADRLSGPQGWLLVDDDPILLEQVPARMQAWADERGYQTIRETDGLVLLGERLTCRVATRRVDLTAIDDPEIFTGRALVTASAFLDLVSERWLRAFADRCRESGAAALFALTYDGRIRCVPDDPEDERIRGLVNGHQHTDKGFGEALGPEATDHAERYFSGVGYVVRCESSDWVLPSEARGLQRALIDGWAEAAVAIAPDQITVIRGWQTRRLAHVAEHRSQLTVGHQDLAAWLPR